jgi:hypothetical protein
MKLVTPGNLVLAVGVAACSAGIAGLITNMPIEPVRSSSEVAIPRAARRLRTGHEIVVVFVGSSTCGASRNSALQAAVQRVRDSLASQAASASKTFAYIGVSLDWSVQDGLSFLKEFGPFDEITVGGNWLNMASLFYILRDIPGPPRLPQILVLEREIHAGPDGVRIGNDTLLERKVGVDAIVQLAGK